MDLLEEFIATDFYYFQINLIALRKFLFRILTMQDSVVNLNFFNDKNNTKEFYFILDRSPSVL